MELHVLGSGGGFPRPGGACAGYLVRAGGQRIVLDCGPGTLGPLLARCRPEDLDAVVISHLHADHFLDLFPLAYALLALCMAADPLDMVRVAIHVPRGAAACLREVSRALGHPTWSFPHARDAPPAYRRLRTMLMLEPDFVFTLLHCVEYDPGETFRVGDVLVCSTAVEHGVPAAALRIESTGRSLVYSGDTRPCTQLVDLACGADLLLCEATVRRGGGLGLRASHMSAADAGAVARSAGVGELALTHFTAGDEAALIEDAGRAFGGPTRLAHDGDVIAIGRRGETAVTW